MEADESAEIGSRSAELVQRFAQLEGADTRLSRLSEAERRLVALVGAGRNSDEIAHALLVSAKTVEWSLTKIFRKLRADAAGQSEVTATGSSIPNCPSNSIARPSAPLCCRQLERR